MVVKMARVFGVTVDFLIEKRKNASYNKETVNRINAKPKVFCSTSLLSTFKILKPNKHLGSKELIHISIKYKTR